LYGGATDTGSQGGELILQGGGSNLAGTTAGNVVINGGYVNQGGTSGNINIGLTNTTALNLPNVANINIPGGSTGQFLQTDGTGNLSFATVTATPAGSNSQVQFNNNGSLGASANFSFSTATNILSVANIEINQTMDVVGYSATPQRQMYRGWHSRGSNGAPSPLLIGDEMFSMTAGAYTGNGAITLDGQAGWVNYRMMYANIAALPTTTGYRPAANLYLQTTNTSDGTNLWTLDYTGNLTAPGYITAIGANLGAVGNVTITGGTAGQVLTTDGSNVLSWANAASTLANVNVVTTATYTVGATDQVLPVTTASATTVTLPAASASIGRSIIVKDYLGTDRTGNAITIAPTGSDTIDGNASFTITDPWNAVTLIGITASQWMIL
jgi:hypothetical protein